MMMIHKIIPIGIAAILYPSVLHSAICFLPDCGKKLEAFDGDANINSQYCRAEGYIVYAGGKCPEYHLQDSCPYDARYLKCDAAGWCRDNGYQTTSCTSPEFLDEPCPNGLPVYKGCKEDTPKACKELNPDYTNICPNGWQVDLSNSCTYNPAYGICCNQCNGYVNAAEIGSGYQKGESCSACGGIIKYKKIEASCSGYVSCPSGAAPGASTCKKGAQTLYSSCCAHNCSLDACPVGNSCTQEVCSGKYCISGCAAGYIDYCTAPTTNCAALGYTASSCSGSKLTCPFGLSKFFCM